MQDIVKPKRSLKEVLPSQEHRPRKTIDYSPVHESSPAYVPPAVPMRPRFRRFGWLFGVAILAIIFFISQAFAQVTIKIQPRQGKLLLDGNYKASNNPQNGELPFKTMSIDDFATRTVPASGNQKIERKASGTIVIFNAFGKDSQRLVANTRFEATGGKIYRINEAVTIPGATTKGSDLVPGSIEVVVTADMPGEAYNLERADLTIPGFKGTPRYEKIYARTKTALSGGIVGEGKSVDSETLAKTRADLQAELREQLVKDARNQIPPNFVLYDDAIFVTYDSEPTITPANGDKAEVKEHATLTGILFNVEDLAKNLATGNITDYQNEPVTIASPEDIKFSIIDKDNFNLDQVEVLNFKLEGNAHIVWLYDQQQLKAELIAEKPRDFAPFFAKFPAIEKAEVIYRPIWVRSLPDNVDKVNINNVIEK